MDISVVVTAHKEGELVRKTLISIFRTIKFARRVLKIELLIILDKADDETKRYVYSYQNELFCRIYEVDFGDVGLSRNFGVSKADGCYTAVFDADDLMSENWLELAYKKLKSFNKQAIVHVDNCFVFNEEEIFYKQCSSLDAKFDVAKFFSATYWNVVCMAPKFIFEKYKYPPSRTEEGFFCEDWEFCIETLAGDVEHIIAEGSSVFIRRRLNSLSRQNKKYVVRSSELFSKERVMAYKDNGNPEKSDKLSIAEELKIFFRYPSLYIKSRAKARAKAKRYFTSELNKKYVKHSMNLELQKEFSEICKIEPAFHVKRFVKKCKDNVWILGTDANRLIFLSYKKLMEQYDFNTDTVIFSSFLNNKYIENKVKGSNRYTVFLTEQSKNDDRLNSFGKNIKVIFLYEILKDLSFGEQMHVMLRFLQQTKPYGIIMNNSPLCNELILEYPDLLAGFSSIIIEKP